MMRTENVSVTSEQDIKKIVFYQDIDAMSITFKDNVHCLYKYELIRSNHNQRSQRSKS